jgi:hypothetical protein
MSFRKCAECDGYAIGGRARCEACRAKDPPRALNRLVVIGWLGTQRCYLNISREEALRRYHAAEGTALTALSDEPPISEFEFDDEFAAYAAYEK